MSSPPTFPGVMLDSLRDSMLALGEITGNHLLAYDEIALAECASLAGRCIAIDIPDLDLSLYVHPGEWGLRLSLSPPAREVDATISGSPGALLNLASQADKLSTSIREGIHFSGDIALAQRLQSIVAELDIDWEEMLARRTGDVAAHQLVKGFHAIAETLRQNAESLLGSGSEYLREEARLTPTRPEFDRFSAQLVELRNDVARVEARLRGLRNARRQA